VDRVSFALNVDITPGTRLGPYEIAARIGAGGMGTVYSARDTRLGRSVAIKVLSSTASADPRLRERLAREGRAVSALAHPNICQLYDVGSADGIDYLVMELLDGQSLADRLSRGPLAVGEALRIAAEVAMALDAAHRAGIVHRDLKPGNIMLTRNGARLLDFGLAKAMRQDADSDAQTVEGLTKEGAVVGTLRYMAPEQLEGLAVDSRADVFAFGLVVYEMLTARPAFAGNSQAALMTQILTGEPPPIRTTNPEVPAQVERIVRRCLRKNPDERWQSMYSLAEALRWAGESSEETPIAPPAVRRRWLVPALAAVALAALAVAAIVLIRGRPIAAPPRTLRFSIAPPPGTTFAQNPVHCELAVSPDGRTLALVGHEGRKRRLFVRALDALSARPIDGTDGAAGPFWSPDSKWIAFFAGGQLKKVPVDGGPVQSIAQAQGGQGSWNRAGQIIFFEWGSTVRDSIKMVRDSGGTIVDITDPKGPWSLWPSFLSDGRHFLFWRLVTFQEPERNGLYVGSIDKPGEERLVVRTMSRGEVRGNEIFYVREAVLVRQRFDPARFAVEGDPAPIADPVSNMTTTGVANFSVSDDGRTVAWQRLALPTQLVWRDWSGRLLSRAVAPELLRHFDISPNGQRIAADLVDRRTQFADIWLFDVARGVKTRLTASVRGSNSPLWLHDGKALVVSSADPAKTATPPDLAVLTLADGSIRPFYPYTGPKYATSITADDKNVIFTVDLGRRRDMQIVPIAGGKPVPLGKGVYDEADAVLSPDQRWLAFESDESGHPEVYIQPFGRNGEKLRVSTDGGVEPRWAPEGMTLFYIDSEGMLIRADIGGGDRARVDRATVLFHVNSASMMEFEALGLRHYAVTRDRILVRELPGGADTDPLVVLVNR
jgi:Tol biopolymer transport system component